ncbi:MAG TPA: lysylphosphatidylglycerol synthase transmembrane domain-containing protein, partial [Anaerolineales bacterium]|nr:lysylphosphatidylglycerol synthase transmembrane domain-containing protein [Anaerolineales bacterium]
MTKSQNNIKQILPGALISILLVAAILYFVDFKTMWEAIKHANYRILAGSAVLSFVWLFMRAKVWQTLMRDKPKYTDVLFAAGEGYLLNAFLPFRLGEVGRVFLLSRKSGMTFSEILPTVVIERVMDLLYSAGMLLIGLTFVADAKSSAQIGYVIGSVMIAGLVMMYIL